METKMNNTNRKMAMIAGFSLLLMAIIAGFAYGYVFKSIYIESSGIATLQNLNNSKSLFKVFLFSFVIIFILDIVVSWCLYIFFKRVNKSLSLLCSLFRLIYSVLLGTALLNMFPILHLLSNINQNEILIMTPIKMFLYIWSFGLLVFGAHLFLLGLLIFKSDFVPKVLGVLILFASICYVVTNSSNLFIPNYGYYKETVDMFLSLPMALGEIVFAIWLAFIGSKEKEF